MYILPKTIRDGIVWKLFLKSAISCSWKQVFLQICVIGFKLLEDLIPNGGGNINRNVFGICLMRARKKLQDEQGRHQFDRWNF